MDDFISHLQILLPVLGADFVRPAPQIRSSIVTGVPNDVPVNAVERSPTETSNADKVGYGASAQPSPEFRLSAGGLAARAVEVDGQMVVLAGSQARKEDLPSLSFLSRARRDQLRSQGRLVSDGSSDCLRFTEDTAFPSPSAAAEAVMGTSRNGRRDWTTGGTGETYAEWQERLVSTAANASELGGTAMPGL